MHPVTMLERLAAMLDRGPVALATVIEVDGSVPRRPGAMMALGADGAEAGTVGGGAMEARVLAAMAATLAAAGGGVGAGGETGAGGDADTGPSVRRESIDLGGDPGDVRDGICGGRMTIEVRRPGPADAAAIRTAVERLSAGRGVALAATSGGRGLVLDEPRDEEPEGFSADPGAGDDAGDDAAGDASVPASAAWRLVVRPRPLLLVVGAGHCGEALARQARLLDLDVVLEDDRATVRERLDVPPGVRVAPGPTRDTLAAIPPGRELLAALVTRSFRQDLAALEALRERRPAYLGVMGSGRRLGTVFALLRERGWTAEELRMLDAPIGLDVGAETPGEIAVSIAAGLIAHRAGAADRPARGAVAAEAS